jgi:hypothetical protein
VKISTYLYLSVSTRLDITYAMNDVAKFSSHLIKKHWSAVKSIMYLIGTVNLVYIIAATSKLEF